jgi:5-methylcytosine-specific restriction protein A
MAVAKWDSNDGRLRGRALQARRLRVWSLDPHCQKCGKLVDYLGDSFQLDHKVPLYKDGEDTDENCQVLCLPCHDRKTMQDMGYRERVEFDKEGRVKW